MKREEIITSTSNSKIKYISTLLKKSSARRKDNVYVVEGLRMVLDAPIDSVECVVVSEELVEKESDVRGYLDKCNSNNVDIVYASSKVIKAVSDTVTPQGILAVIRRKNYEIDTTKDTYLLLEDIQDPGNLGTLFRTAEAAGIDEIIMSRDCVDIYNPKTIRSTMGTIYRMPHFLCKDGNEWNESINALQESGVELFGGALDNSDSYDAVDYTKRVGIVIGNEGNGITGSTLDMISRIHIPMEGSIESLNAAMAGGIIMYEINRQRREKRWQE